MVTMWDVQGPGVFTADVANGGGWGVASTIASAAVSTASQLLLGAFCEVSGLNAELDLETYQAGGENTSVKRFVKTGKHPNLSFKRGVSFNADLWDWHQQVVHGSDAVMRKSGIILLLERASLAGNGSGNAVAQLTRPPIAAWYFTRGLPERLTGPSLDAKSSAIAIETLEIAHEGLTRVSLGSIPGIADAAAGVGGLLSAAASGAAAFGAVAALGGL